jgi:hypothetical protein
MYEPMSAKEKSFYKNYGKDDSQKKKSTRQLRTYKKKLTMIEEEDRCGGDGTSIKSNTKFETDTTFSILSDSESNDSIDKESLSKLR